MRKHLAIISPFFILLTIIFSLMSPVQAQSWLTGWTYRKSHVVTSASGAGANYQLKFFIHRTTGTDSGAHLYLGTNIASDFSDLRFTDDDGTTLLDYWIESISSGVATVWVEIADSLSSVSRTIYVYYGRDNSRSLSRGDETFTFWDGFGIWEKQGLVIPVYGGLTGLNEPNVYYEENPQILTDETMVFKMWCRASYPSDTETWYFESTDGITWEAYSGNPVLDTAGAFCPFVFEHAGVKYLYVHDGWDNIDRYYSTDYGLSWTLDKEDTLVVGAGGQWDDYALGNVFVWVEGTSDWYMIYEGNPSVHWALGLAESSDGKTWVKDGSNPVIEYTGGNEGAGGAHVEKIGSTYYCWFHGGNLPTDGCRMSSTDLTTWTNVTANPVYPRTESYEGVDQVQGQISDMHYLQVDELGLTYNFYEAVYTQADHRGIALATTSYTLEELVETTENGLDSVSKWEGDTSYADMTTTGYLTYLGDAGWQKLNSQYLQSTGSALHQKSQFIGREHDNTWGSIIGWRHDVSDNWIQIVYFDDDVHTDIRTNDAGSITSMDSNPDTTERIYEIRWLANDASFYMDGVEMINSSITTNIPSVTLPVMYESIGGVGYEVLSDWVFTRRYVYPEPQHSTWGAEESLIEPPDVDVTIDLASIPSYLAVNLGITLFQTQIMISSLVLMAVGMPLALMRAKGLILIVVCFSTMGFLVAMGWLPFWIMLMVSLITAILLASKFKNIL